MSGEWEWEATGWRLVRARAVAALALASAGLPCVVRALEVARAQGSPPLLAGVVGGWLGLALILYLPLFLREARWPLRAALGSSLWAAGGLTWSLGALASEWLPLEGVAAGALVVFPSAAALFHAWVRPVVRSDLGGACALLPFSAVFGVGGGGLALVVLLPLFAWIAMQEPSAGLEALRELLSAVPASAFLAGALLGSTSAISAAQDEDPLSDVPPGHLERGGGEPPPGGRS